MGMQVETKDCTALADAELAEMAELIGTEPVRYDVGHLSKERDSWVLVTQVRDGDTLVAFGFSTLERIGGTPCVLTGLAGVTRSGDRAAALAALRQDIMRRAVLAFPDEDVLVSVRLNRPDGFAFLEGLNDVLPGRRANGEERAWGRRLVKRYSITGAYDDRAFVVTGKGDVVSVMDLELDGASAPGEAGALFDDVDPARGDVVIAFGWAMAEDLAELLSAS